MEVGNMRLCVLSTDSVFNFLILKIKFNVGKCTELCYKHSKKHQE